jgi:hypothetical protein
MELAEEEALLREKAMKTLTCACAVILIFLLIDGAGGGGGLAEGQSHQDSYLRMRNNINFFCYRNRWSWQQKRRC